MANIKSIGGNPIVLGLDGLTNEAKASLGNSTLCAASDSLLGTPATDTWATRVSTGDGAASVERLMGNTVVWNQLVYDMLEATSDGITTSYNASTGLFSITNDSRTSNYGSGSTRYDITHDKTIIGHKLIVVTDAPSGVVAAYETPEILPNNTVFTATQNEHIHLRVTSSYDFVTAHPVGSVTAFHMCIYDLTQMFGAGNEPTVAEFKRMFPEPYYPYSAPTLKSVNISGMESVGFNLWDEVWENGVFLNESGNPYPSASNIMSKNYIRIDPQKSYYLKFPYSLGSIGVRVVLYDSSKSVVRVFTKWSANLGPADMVPSARYMRWATNSGSTPTYNNDICINLSDPALNGTYRPYRHVERPIPVSTYFPTGMKSAGTVRDELTATRAVTRIGVVDLGTITWVSSSTTTAGKYRMVASSATGIADLVKKPSSDALVANITCAKYDTVSLDTTYIASQGISIGTGGGISVYDPDYDTSNSGAAFKAAMSGVLLFYELATPTTQEIDPPLPLAYRIERGGTEGIVVPDGEVSAPPVLTIADGKSAQAVVMDALAAIAAPDGPVATANHAVGTYLTMQGKLYKVTSAIAVGETITPNTNVTQTTVMAELIARTA